MPSGSFRPITGGLSVVCSNTGILEVNSSRQKFHLSFPAAFFSTAQYLQVYETKGPLAEPRYSTSACEVMG